MRTTSVIAKMKTWDDTTEEKERNVSKRRKTKKEKEGQERKRCGG